MCHMQPYGIFAYHTKLLLSVSVCASVCVSVCASVFASVCVCVSVCVSLSCLAEPIDSLLSKR